MTPIGHPNIAISTQRYLGARRASSIARVGCFRSPASFAALLSAPRLSSLLCVSLCSILLARCNQLMQRLIVMAFRVRIQRGGTIIYLSSTESGRSLLPKPNVLRIFPTHRATRLTIMEVYIGQQFPQPRRMEVNPANHHQTTREVALHWHRDHPDLLPAIPLSL